MKQKQIKDRAKVELMWALQIAFTDTAGIPKEIQQEMAQQFERVENLFGFERGSFTKGV